jgi:hypothetical protein
MRKLAHGCVRSLQNSAALRTKVFGGMFGGATQKQNSNSTIISFAYSCNMMDTPAI